MSKVPDLNDCIFMQVGNVAQAIAYGDYTSNFTGGRLGSIPDMNDRVLMSIGGRIVPISLLTFQVNFLGGLVGTVPDRNDFVMMSVGFVETAVSYSDFITSSWGAQPPAGALFWHQYPQSGMEQTSGGAVANDGDPVGRWLDLSGNGRHLLQPTAGERYTVDAAYGGLTQWIGTVQNMTVVAAPDRANFSMFWVGDPNGCLQAWNGATTYDFQMFWAAQAPGAYHTLFIDAASGGKLGWQDTGTTVSTGLYVPSSRCLVGLVSSAGGLKLVLNGQSEDVTAMPAGAISSFILKMGLYPGYPLPGRHVADIAYNSAINAAQLAQVRAWAQGLGAVFTSPNTVVVAGDSISDSWPIANNHGWNQTLGLGGSALMYNVSEGGQYLTTIASRDYAAHYTNTRKILVVFAGTNDIAFGGTGASTYAALAAYCATKRAASYKVVVVTTLPGVNTNETQRQIYNNSTRANWMTFADGLADVETLPMGAAGNYASTAYYSPDQVHPNQVGHAALRGLIKPKIQALLV